MVLYTLSTLISDFQVVMKIVVIFVRKKFEIEIEK